MPKQSPDAKVSKLTAQIATLKQNLREAKANLKAAKQGQKMLKASMKGAWQDEIDSQCAHALSVGYELGYLEALVKQREQHAAFVQQLSAAQPTGEVDYDGLNAILKAQGSVSVPMPEPKPLTEEQENVSSTAESTVTPAVEEVAQVVAEEAAPAASDVTQLDLVDTIQAAENAENAANTDSECPQVTIPVAVQATEEETIFV